MTQNYSNIYQFIRTHFNDFEDFKHQADQGNNVQDLDGTEVIYIDQKELKDILKAYGAFDNSTFKGFWKTLNTIQQTKKNAGGETVEWKTLSDAELGNMQKYYEIFDAVMDLLEDEFTIPSGVNVSLTTLAEYIIKDGQFYNANSNITADDIEDMEEQILAYATRAVVNSQKDKIILDLVSQYSNNELKGYDFSKDTALNTLIENYINQSEKDNIQDLIDDLKLIIQDYMFKCGLGSAIGSNELGDSLFNQETPIGSLTFMQEYVLRNKLKTTLTPEALADSVNVPENFKSVIQTAIDNYINAIIGDPSSYIGANETFRDFLENTNFLRKFMDTNEGKNLTKALQYLNFDPTTWDSSGHTPEGGDNVNQYIGNLFKWTIGLTNLDRVTDIMGTSKYQAILKEVYQKLVNGEIEMSEFGHELAKEVKLNLSAILQEAHLYQNEIADTLYWNARNSLQNNTLNMSNDELRKLANMYYTYLRSMTDNTELQAKIDSVLKNGFDNVPTSDLAAQLDKLYKAVNTVELPDGPSENVYDFKGFKELKDSYTIPTGADGVEIGTTGVEWGDPAPDPSHITYENCTSTRGGIKVTINDAGKIKVTVPDDFEYEYDTITFDLCVNGVFVTSGSFRLEIEQQNGAEDTRMKLMQNCGFSGQFTVRNGVNVGGTYIDENWPSAKTNAIQSFKSRFSKKLVDNASKSGLDEQKAKKAANKLNAYFGAVLSSLDSDLAPGGSAGMSSYRNSGNVYQSEAPSSTVYYDGYSFDGIGTTYCRTIRGGENYGDWETSGFSGKSSASGVYVLADIDGKDAFDVYVDTAFMIDKFLEFYNEL